MFLEIPVWAIIHDGRIIADHHGRLMLFLKRSEALVRQDDLIKQTIPGERILAYQTLKVRLTVEGKS